MNSTELSNENLRYKLSPHITLGTLEDSLISMKGEAITKIGGDGVIPFIKSILEELTQKEGVSLDQLSNKLQVKNSELLEVMDFLVDNSLVLKANEFKNAAFLSYERSGRQVDFKTITERIYSESIELISDRSNNPLAISIFDSLHNLEFNVSHNEEVSSPSIRIVIASSYLDPILEENNLKSLEDGTPWLSVVAYDGEKAWVGPFFLPNESACLYCFNLRRSANFSDDIFRSELMNINPLIEQGEPVYHDPTNLIQAGITSNLVKEWVTLKEYAPSAVPGGFKTIHLNENGIDLETHRVLKVPRCPKCSKASDTGFPQVWFHEGGNK